MAKDKNIDVDKLKSLKDKTKNEDLKESIAKKLPYVNTPRTIIK